MDTVKGGGGERGGGVRGGVTEEEKVAKVQLSLCENDGVEIEREGGGAGGRGETEEKMKRGENDDGDIERGGESMNGEREGKGGGEGDGEGGGGRDGNRNRRPTENEEVLDVWEPPRVQEGEGVDRSGKQFILNCQSCGRIWMRNARVYQVV